MLVLESPFQHDELLPAIMCVSGEVAAWRISDNGGGSRHLPADPVKHAAIDPGHWRSLPLK